MNDFAKRRAEARLELDKFQGAKGGTPHDRDAWFHHVYQRAGDDEAGVPWVDLEVKPEIAAWLSQNRGNGRTAIDIACGLGDNAEALAAAGYLTTAFDLVPDAISWAKRRFPVTDVTYRTADLFNLPKHWTEGFDLVLECSTVQALWGERRIAAIKRIQSLVGPGGRLLVYTRYSKGKPGAGEGPPWPLVDPEIDAFAGEGLTFIERQEFKVEKSDGRTIAHIFAILERASSPV